MITRRDLIPILSAVIIGSVSGYYIFSPGLKQIGNEQRREIALRKLEQQQQQQQQQQPNSDSNTNPNK